MAITASMLAAILHEELEADQWGDIDPFWIKMASEGKLDSDEANYVQAKALVEVFERVAERLNENEHDNRERERVFKVGCEFYAATGEVLTKKCYQQAACVGETPDKHHQYVLCIEHGREWVSLEWSRSRGPARLVTHLGTPCTISDDGTIVPTEEQS